ncbi:MAG: hypothetical protein F2772_11260 [Actinobacteria bacterium]|nr:hypothetical protein [Actinomycetota bacterium]
MRATEFITEGATSVLYHYCGTNAAWKILKSGNFLLSNVTGNFSEKQYAPPGYPYFLSTSRSKVGDYHNYTGSSAVMFVLDGNWLGSRYKVGPIDYWERSWQFTPNRTRETEDRVFSKTPEISTECIRAVHVLLKENMENRSPEVRQILIMAKTRGLPTFLYRDEKAWRIQDTRKAIQPSQSGDLLKGQEYSGKMYRPGRNLMDPWMELIYKSNKQDLSPDAEKLRHNLVYYGKNHPFDDQNLGVDMSNARKPSSGADYDSANKLTDYMRRNKYPDTVALKTALVKKWDKIK